ncbi:protein eva-1 homolog C isoform X2 [Thalassophryne amazonica]|uniref:protein eva-1 homolog C isoform X2 n=1 Tax=Thalassophryne amazonica TaxID=390379 RepID=UPI001471D059|nr:protein eva-1 homolog C isoform X2 [Thalassophryne amazonica]
MISQRGHGLFYLTLLLWTRRVHALSDFSNYLSRIITSHSAHACDGHRLRLHCPRHSTISIQSAFYGSSGARLCGADPAALLRTHNHSCSAFTALQKLLSECQSHRDCQLPVTHLLFGKDPCPGTTKYLHVDYKCKPTEHKRHVVCEGEKMVLRCKSPKVLNIYAAVYGRSLGKTDTCPSHLSRLTPFVPLTLLREADPDAFTSTSSPTVDTERVPHEDPEEPSSKGSRLPDSSGTMSSSLLTYAYIKEHPEMAALLFMSSMCVGLLLTILAISVRETCRGQQLRDRRTSARFRIQTQTCSEDEEEAEDEEGTESSVISEAERRMMSGWEEVTYVSEAAERAERIERRDMVVQEIWMNAYLNRNSCQLNSPLYGVQHQVSLAASHI